MAKKADAFKEYREAAMVDMMLKVLPQVAAEISGPISQANKITMIASGDGAIGANRWGNISGFPSEWSTLIGPDQIHPDTVLSLVEICAICAYHSL